MKIYLNKKEIVDKTLLDENDIPLSYLNNLSVYSDTIIKYDDKLLKLNKKRAINLYEKVDKNKLFFKENNEPAKINKDYLVDIDGKIDLLNSSKKSSYRPTIFGYKYVLERTIPFQSDKEYTINIDFTGMEHVKELLKTVTLPNNLHLNSVQNNPDIKYFSDEKAYLENMRNGGYQDNCNIYIVKSSYANKIIYNKPKIFDVAKPVIFTQSEYTIEPSWDIFNHDSEMSLFPRVTYNYIKLTINHTPILIMRDRLNYKLIMLCGKEIFTQERLIKFLVENIIYAYTIGYYKVPEASGAYLNSFISNNIIDYYYSLNNRMNSHHPTINFKKDIEASNFKDTSYKLVDVFTTDSNIVYDYTDYSNNVYFKKTVNNEPEKSNTDSLIYTTNQELKFIDKVNYSLYDIEQLPNISYKYNNDKLEIVVSPYYSSSQNIAKSEQTYLTIHDINKNYVLYMRKTSIIADQEFYILEDTEQSNDIKIADIIIKLNNNIVPTDVRVIGGGSSKYDNYDYIDTGNINGRLYRVGTSMVITLPKRYEPYRNQLQQQINKHISSAEAAIIIFKD